MFVLNKIFQKIEEKGTLPNSFHEVSITLIVKPEKDSTKNEKIFLSVRKYNSAISKIIMPQIRGIYSRIKSWFNI